MRKFNTEGTETRSAQRLAGEARRYNCRSKPCVDCGSACIQSALGGKPMQAAVVPAVSGSWQVREVPQPKPGPNQVLVKMHASGICYTDVHETLGHIPGEFPRILGHEPVGEIVAVA